MTQIDRAAATLLQNEIAAAVRAIAEKHGLKVASNRCTYGASEAKFSLTLGVIGEDGVDARYRTEWDSLHGLYGFDASDLGKTFRTASGEVRIVGLDSKRRKFPVVCQHTTTGKISLFVVKDVRRMLGKPPRQWEV